MTLREIFLFKMSIKQLVHSIEINGVHYLWAFTGSRDFKVKQKQNLVFVFDASSTVLSRHAYNTASIPETKITCPVIFSSR